MCEEKLPTYFISSEDKVLSKEKILHFDLKNHKEVESNNYLPEKDVINILLTSGASCPDATVERVLRKVHSYFPEAIKVDEVVNSIFQ